jgi:tetratricopeptide (TPR) repeat protein
LAEREAKDLARDAFYALDEKPFDVERRSKALEDIQRAAKQSPKEPWVAIATSRAILELGYSKGDRYRLTSFDPEAVEKAEEYAKQSVLLGPNESLAYSQLARVQLIRGNYRPAWDTLNQAHEKDPNDFYPWYLRGVLSNRMKNAERAKAALDEAEKHATQLYQGRLTLYERMTLAKLTGDLSAEERIYKQLIDLDPQNAHAYGNYANFLLSQKRYDEAIASYEKALSIASYPLAREQLERAKQLKNSAPK